MTEADLDLTRLAALAALYDVYEEDGEFFHRNPTVRECGGWRMTFDPLHNEGDRWRLARDAGLRVDFAGRSVFAPDANLFLSWPHHEPDEAHAVVRAAAEIAKAQQGGGDA